MKLLLCLLHGLVILLFAVGSTISVFGQADSFVGQITNSTFANTLVRDISGNGRFVVFESNGDLATQGRQDQFSATGQLAQAARNNADGNVEIFLFDYAQRRIFQITNTKRALKNVTGSSTANNNIQVDVANTRPTISNDGRFIAFTSNAAATFASGAQQITQTPAFFDGNLCLPTATATDCNVGTSGTNAIRPTLTRLQADGNNEIWLYRIPDAVVNAPVSLSSGADVPLLEASGGAFVRVTDSPQSFAPVPGTDLQTALIRDDNIFPSINDDGSVIAFVSDRDYTGGNAGAENANREIFVYRRSADNTGVIRQATTTTRGTFTQQTFNTNPSISGNGRRVAFVSTANLPRAGGLGGGNSDFNTEVFYVNLSDNGTPETVYGQVTNTAQTAPEQTTNLFNTGRRISRDGRFIAYESLAADPNGGGAVDQNGYALFVHDIARNTNRQIGARTFGDPNAAGGDVRRFPVFTDNTGDNNEAQTLVFASRQNLLPNGTVSTAGADGLNLDPVRPVQIYSTPLNAAAATPTVALTRLTRNTATAFLGDIQPAAANTSQRIAFTLGGAELGGGNSDFSSEAFYLLTPTVTNVVNDSFQYFTGASDRRVGTATATPSPSPSATPATPDAVSGLSRGMLATLRLRQIRPSGGATAPEFAGFQRTFFKNQLTERRFELPIELAGVRLSINNAAAGIYSVDRLRREITFVVPVGSLPGTFDIVVNDNGRVIRNTTNSGNNRVPIVAAQPDVFTFSPIAAAGGRARAFNATNRVLQAEPFTVTTFRRKPFGRVPTVVRVFATGIADVPASALRIRVGNESVSQILTGATPTDQPGVYSVDFTLPAALNVAGDVPIVIEITTGTSSRLADTAPRVRIL